MIHSLHEPSLKLMVFTDPSFANNADFSTQLAHCIILGVRSARASCIHYASYKSKRVLRSVIGGGLLALADAYNHVFLVRNDFGNWICTWSPLILLTDSLSRFNLILHTSPVSTEKRQVTEITALREASYCRNISDIRRFRSFENLAHAFIKPGVCAALETFPGTGNPSLDVPEYVVRSTPPVSEKAGGFIAPTHFASMQRHRSTYERLLCNHLCPPVGTHSSLTF